MKVTVDSIECVLFSMYVPRDKGYANYDLAEYINGLIEVSDICKNTASQYFVLGVILTHIYQGILFRQELSVHFLIMNTYIYVLMPNVPYTYCSKSNDCKKTILW